MKIVKNEKLISRNAKIGRYASLLGLFTVIGTTVFLMQSLFKPKTITGDMTWIILVILLVSMVISQVSMYYGNRFGRRPDEALDRALKGLPGDFTIYHYASPVPHLLIGPAGVWIILPYFLRGVVTYRKNRWRVGGGGFGQSYLRIFGQESIGRPDLEAGGQAAALEKFLKRKFEQGEALPPIYAVLAFLDDKAEIHAEDAPLPALPVKKLKDFLRKAAKEKPFPASDLARLKAALGGE